MRQNRSGNVQYVFQSHHVAAEKRSPRTGTKNKILHGTRTSTPAHKRFEPSRRCATMRPSLADQTGRILIYMVRHRDTADEILKLYNVRRMEQVGQFRQLIASGSPGNFDLLVLRRVIECDQEHEAIKLRFRKRIGALLLDRILSRQY